MMPRCAFIPMVRSPPDLLNTVEHNQHILNVCMLTCAKKGGSRGLRFAVWVHERCQCLKHHSSTVHCVTLCS